LLPTLEQHNDPPRIFEVDQFPAVIPIAGTKVDDPFFDSPLGGFQFCSMTDSIELKQCILVDLLPYCVIVRPCGFDRRAFLLKS
jgi:hypothetical protein